GVRGQVGRRGRLAGQSGRALVEGRAAGRQVVVVAGGVGEELGGRGEDRVGVLSGRRLPLGQRDVVSVVGREQVLDGVVVADQPRQAVGGDVDAAVRRVVVVQDVVQDDVAGA